VNTAGLRALRAVAGSRAGLTGAGDPAKNEGGSALDLAIYPMDDQALIRVLKALGHPTRFRLVQEIATTGELSCGQLGGCVEAGQPTVSHHLKILTDAGVLTMRRDGQFVRVSVNRELVEQVLGLLPAKLCGPPARAARGPRAPGAPRARKAAGRRSAAK
jgi:DNA-binding transcriptional ArsR family regulator